MLEVLFIARDAPMNMGLLFEYTQIMWFILLITHCYRTKGKWITIQIYLIGMLYGLVLENGGPLQFPLLGFEGFFYEDNYNLYLFEAFGVGYRISLVPLATHLGWSSVFYVSVILWEKVSQLWPSLRKHAIWGGLLFSMSGWLQDLQIDIVATRFNWWVWNENLKPVWFGVPWVNYLAWFWAVFWFGWLWVQVHGEDNTKTLTNADQKAQTIKIMKYVPVLWVLDLIGHTITLSFFASLGLIYI